MPQPRLPHRFLVQWLVLAGALLLVGSAAAYALMQEWGRVGLREEERLQAMTRVVQVSLEQNLASINGVLVALVAELAGDRLREDLDQRLENLVDAMPGVRTLVVLDSVGMVRAASRPELRTGTLDFGQRDYFLRPGEVGDATLLYVSPPFRTALGVYSLNVSRIVRSGTGSFDGVVAATLDPRYFDPLIDSVRYAPDMVASLQHGEGVVFAIAPPQQGKVIGQNLAQPGTFFTRHRESGRAETVYSGVLRATGEHRMIAQRTVQPAALRMDRSVEVAVSRLSDEIYASWRHDVMVTAALLGSTALALGLGLHAHQRRYRRFEQQQAAAQRALAKSERHLKAIIEAEPECVLLLDAAGRLLQMNRAGLEMFQAGEGLALLGHPLAEQLLPEHRPAFAALQAQVAAGASATLAFEISGLLGRRRWLDVHAVPLAESGEEGGEEGPCLLAVARDITEHRRVLHSLEQLAQTDALTGLLNRRHFIELAGHALVRARRYGEPLSLLMLDLDHFKDVNDSHGHQAGDRVLQQLADLTRETLRSIDLCGRLGGEEFAVLLPQTAAPQAAEAAERLRQAVAGASFPAAEGVRLHLTLSIGVASLAGDKCLDALLGRADEALYEAKHAGRDQVRTAPQP